MTDLNADDVIFVGVEIRFAAKRVAADFVLFDAGGGIGEGALADVNQDLMELKRFGELAACRNAQDQSPAVVLFDRGGRVGVVQSSVQTRPPDPNRTLKHTVTRNAVH